MILTLTINTKEIPPDSDPILELIPLLKDAGFKLVGNGIGFPPNGGGERYLRFEFPKEWPTSE